MTLSPTAEQALAIELFNSGKSLAIEAGAGTGKTSTLKLMAESAPRRRGQYVAFNKSIVVDAGSAMPPQLKCRTAHSLAFGVVGKKFKTRLDESKRMRSDHIARELRLNPLYIRRGAETKVLQPGYLAGLVLRSINNFCQSGDPEPTEAHVPYIDGLDEVYDDGRRSYTHNRQVRAHVAPALKRAWSDLCSLNGRLPYTPSHYLKLWQLSSPAIYADYIAFDEAQDASGVMLAIVQAQTHAQHIYVGDSNQAINEWMGAIDALSKVQVEKRCRLTQSFRFGPAVAEVANIVLERLDTDMRLVGTDRVDSVVAPLDDPLCVLTRTNAAAVATVMRGQAEGRRVHLIGDSVRKDVLGFAYAAEKLMAGERTEHRDLGCFENWGEVVDYVENDQLGGEIKLMVKLIEDNGTAAIISALNSMPQERDAQLIVSTAHKSKGRQWDSVQLGGDYPEDRSDDTGELRLLYVAATRAKRELDISMCGPLDQMVGEWGSEPEIESPPVIPPADVKPEAPALAIGPPVEEEIDAKALTALYGGR